MQQILQFLKNNILWIILITLILVSSNILTGISVNSLSRKEKQKIQHEKDSLQDRYKQLDFIHQVELAKRRKIFLEDSLLKIDLYKAKEKDRLLIIQQAQALKRFKLLSPKQNLAILDSAYHAENPNP